MRWRLLDIDVFHLPQEAVHDALAASFTVTDDGVEHESLRGGGAEGPVAETNRYRGSGRVSSQGWRGWSQQRATLSRSRQDGRGRL